MMKNLSFLGMLLAVIFSSVCLSSCSKDDDDQPKDAASEVAGIYTGKLKVNNTVIKDAYIVTVTKISSTVVRVSAELFTSGGGENYNLTLEGSQYTFTSATSSGITISVIGKSMTLNFLNGSNTMTTFVGNRD